MHHASRLLLVSALLLSATAHAGSITPTDARSLALSDVEPMPRAVDVELHIGQVLSWGGGTFVQVEQSWDGMPIHGGRIVVAYDDQARLRDVIGAPTRALPIGADPTVDVATAVATAQSWASDEQAAGQLWSPRAQLGLLAQDQLVHTVWVVDVSTAQPVGAWRVFVDAHNGQVLQTRQNLWTAQADVYPTNPVASELTEVELLGVEDELSNDYAHVRSCTDFDDQTWQCNAKTSWAVADEDGDFFFEPDPMDLEDPFAEVQMFWHLDRVARWFDDEFGFRTDYGLAGNAVEGIVNFNLANAFYGDADGDGVPEVAFGQGNGADFSYDADVVYHEFGHAVFGSVVDSDGGRWDEYGRLVAPSGLNEGSADLFALALTGDPMLGEYAGSGLLGSGAIRELDEDRHCPTDIYGESHRDGEIWAAFGWNVIEDEALGGQVAAHLVFGALNRWDTDVNFGEAGRSLLDSADDMLDTGFITTEQHELLGMHIADAGLDDCGRVIRLDEGQEPTQMMMGRRGNDGERRLFPLPNQFSLDAPEGAVALRFYVEELASNEPLFGARIHVRRGNHVVHAMEEVETNWGTRTVAVPDEFDFTVETWDEGLAVELTADTEPALEPGATYYFSLVGWPDDDMQGFGFAEITLRGEADIVPVEEEPEEDGDGCTGCSARVGGSTTATTSLALALLLGVFRRRGGRSRCA